ncbi:MAG: signal recognition particle subunit SRP19/SEC65 family protein [Methanoregulaceae archaeon]
MPVKGERILYPCYFNAGLTREEGRRVPKSLAAKAPTAAEIERALKKSGIKARIEPQQHPGHWFRKEGRVVAETEIPKKTLLLNIAKALAGKA